jgi:chromosome segregation ATPase
MLKKDIKSFNLIAKKVSSSLRLNFTALTLFISAEQILRSLTSDIEALEFFKTELCEVIEATIVDVEDGEQRIQEKEVKLKAVREKVFDLKTEIEVTIPSSLHALNFLITCACQILETKRDAKLTEKDEADKEFQLLADENATLDADLAATRDDIASKKGSENDLGDRLAALRSEVETRIALVASTKAELDADCLASENRVSEATNRLFEARAMRDAMCLEVEELKDQEGLSICPHLSLSH